MRKDIGLKMISADVIDPRSGRPTSATIAFEVSYTSTSADLAAKVANELTTLYLNENLNNRTQLARDAATFLESEGDRLNRRIGDLESELAKLPSTQHAARSNAARSPEPCRDSFDNKSQLSVFNLSPVCLQSVFSLPRDHAAALAS